ncbi:MAG: hypothetical protein HC828_07290 [Blastochloris sp.]|nr:hypothetical protein [Blastochloris sp.]
MALDRLLKQPLPPEVVAEVQELLESEQGLSHGLRVICERLHPTGLNDPYGLESVLRAHVERTEMLWHGQCDLRVRGEALPLGQRQQREVVRIVREGLNNAVKHADADQITVWLRYPAAPDGWVEVVIADNGQGGPIQSRSGHHGVRNMQESARSAGGALQFAQAVGGGTQVIMHFPALPDQEERPWAMQWGDETR